MLSNVFTPATISQPESTTLPVPSRINETKKDVKNFREICCDTGVISGASGSAYLSFGETKVYCSVFGPRANQRGAVSGPFADSALLECDVRIAASDSHILSSSSEPRMAQQLRDSLAPSIRLSCYPKTVISIYAVIIQSAGGELAAIISCASLALADASIEMNDFVCATTIGMSKSSEGNGDSKSIIIVDPCTAEYSNLAAVLTLSSMVSYGSVLTHLSVEGFLSTSDFAQLISLAKSGCSYLRSILFDCMRRRQLRYQVVP
jgi:ribonuclease PH